MGKSKEKDKDKKKKKDKDKERSKKDKDSSKEKSRHKSDRKHSPGEEPPSDSNSKHHSRHHGSPSRSKEKREDLKRKRSPDPKEHRSKRSHVDKPEERDVEVKVESKGSEISMSIEETNKLRLQLGLKPLDVGSTNGGGTSKGDTAATTSTEGTNEDTQDTPSNETTESVKKEPQHAPPKNIGEQAAAEKLREKLKVMRETREIAKKLSSVKGLGEADDGDGDLDASLWVARMKEREKEKEMAQKRAKLLEEMDDEFGISEMMKSEGYPSLDKKAPSYTSASLAGVKIQHKEDHFMEGRDVVLTLKDAAILDEGDGDVLVNVNMMDDEHASRNVQMKKGLPGYTPYEEEFDEYGNPKTRSLLYKYDEEIDGVKKDSFVLDQRGTFNVGQLEKEKQESKRILEQRAIKLEMPKAVLASEYFTNEEMVQFKKRKRRKKKDKFKADDLMPLGNEEEPKDHGSRHRRVTEPENENEPTENRDQPMETESAEPTDIKPDPVLMDEQDSTVESALARTRRLLKGGSSMADRKTGAAFVATMVAAVPRVKQEPVDNTGDQDDLLVLNTTAEFCRNIGGEEDEDEKEERHQHAVVMEEEEMNIEGIKEEQMDDSDEGSDSNSNHGGWTEVDPTLNTDGNPNKKPSDDVDVLELDVVMSTGVAAALQMASKKGFIDTGKSKKKDGSSKTIIDGQAIRDWEYERDRGREREREHTREMPFAEKSGYKPDVNIEYVDNMGRLMTPKEAFRHMSHKFHGKTSGKKKEEKRMKRLQEEFLLNQASTVDTPLQTVELFRKRQENSQSAYVVLSGTQQQHALNMTELTKRK